MPGWIPEGKSEAIDSPLNGLPLKDELGWPIRNKDGEVVLARAAILKSMGRLWLATMFILGLSIAKTGWTAAHARPAWPDHFLYATVFWLVFTVPVGWVARGFWRVLSLFALQDDQTERLRQLRKLQELDDRENREAAKLWLEAKQERRRVGREHAQEIAERRQVIEGQRQIEEDLG